MGFVRTKNGIYDKDKLIKHENIWFTKKLVPLKVIKESENLLDLCDGFIVEEKDNSDSWFVMKTFEFERMSIEDIEYTKRNWNYKAFIKINKGLIYVAEVGKEGEVELL